MRAGRTICETAHVVSLALWIGAVGMSAVTAAIVFPTMRELDPVLPGYGGYEGEHWALAAGKVAFQVFFAADVVQLGAGAMALLTFLLATLAFGLPTARVSTFVRACFLIGAIGVVSYHLFVLAPRMNSELRAYWLAAAAGETATAEAHRAAFSGEHPRARFVLSATGLLALGALAAGVWSIARCDGGAEAPGGVGRAAAASELEEPALARRRA